MFSKKKEIDIKDEGLKALESLGLALIHENKRARRNRWLMWLVFAGFLLALFVFSGRGLSTASQNQAEGEHVALIQMSGVVMAGADIDARLINQSLRNAFEADDAKAIVLSINSPGGSPTQAERIYDEIDRLQALYPDKPIYSVIEDVGASAAYYIAAATDEIYSARSSLVGSIGVLINGFGAVDALKKLGIERRLITAGANKGMLDPFSAEQPQHRALLQTMVDDIHVQFIEAVKQGRGDRLKPNADTFSGAAWNGTQAFAMGLTDGINDVDGVARELVGIERVVNYNVRQHWLEELSNQLGARIAQSINAQISGVKIH